MTAETMVTLFAGPGGCCTGTRWAGWTGRNVGYSVRVSVPEVGVLQSFPQDYPWQGTKTQQYRQVGDAVPPLLFMHIVRPRLAARRPATRSDVA